MQISGVNLALTWSHRLCLFRVLLCGSLCYRLSPFQALGKVTLPRVVRPVCLFTVHVGGGSSPSPVKFSSHCHFHKLSCFCLLGGAAAPAGHHVCLQFTWEVGLPSSHKLPRSWLLGACPAPARGFPACPACLFRVPGRIPFPQSSVLRVPHPLSSVS
jgi:hypothetical protein